MTTTTLSYKSVLVLAQSKGYNNVTIAFTRKVWGDNAPGWQEIEKDENLCELTLIQKWLRDEHKICVIAAPLKNDIFLYQITFITVRKGESYAVALVNELFEEEKRGYKCPTLAEHEANNYTYEEALLNGINEALKLL